MRFPAWLAVFILLLPPTAQAAISIDQGVVSYGDRDDETVLTLAIASDKSNRGAAISVEAAPGAQYDADWTPLTVYFTTAAEWDRFMAMWTKAMQTPAADTPIDTGDYLDPQTKVLISVTKDPDGAIGFSLYNGHHPFLLDIEASQFILFQSHLSTVSAYFEEIPATAAP